MAQPSLSQQIRALEEELGGPLIERLPRAIRLTQAGKAFLPEARATVLSAERAARAARSAMKLEGGELEIATVRSIAVGILPRTIQLWHERHPSVSIRLREYIHRDALAAPCAAASATSRSGRARRTGAGSIAPLGYEEFVVVLPPRDPLASGRGGLPLERLAHREWVSSPRTTASRSSSRPCAGGPGFQPRESVRTEQVEAAARLAAVGLGPTLVPRNMVPAGLDAAALGTEPPVVRELVAFVRADWSAAARGYLDLVQELPWARRPARALVVP